MAGQCKLWKGEKAREGELPRFKTFSVEARHPKCARKLRLTLRPQHTNTYACSLSQPDPTCPGSSSTFHIWATFLRPSLPLTLSLVPSPYDHCLKRSCLHFICFLWSHWEQGSASYSWNLEECLSHSRLSVLIYIMNEWWWRQIVKPAEQCPAHNEEFTVCSCVRVLFLSFAIVKSLYP